MNEIKVQTVVYKEGKYYVAQCLDVDVSSFGKTEKEALANLKEALELYFEDSSTKDIQQIQSPKVVRLSLARA